MKPVDSAVSIASVYVELFRAISVAMRTPRVVAALTISAGIVSFSAIVYMILEGWSLLDAIYFCFVTMSTVGYGDFAPHTALGKIFTIFYLLIGIGTFVLTVSAIAEAIVAEYKAIKQGEDAS
ncbi:MAG: two pore domain potassium channel family protein [Cereibacter sphaeroides]|uniref:Two pore domain potassium channel family protein n=1 Tax=Cereibacter sphaeroides TaxID=1063 RepID=A0A2W5TX94_CERSP|nr:MAG: two pore domain potassium channel family protein [Cereibacter sphaeroides]